MANVKNTNNLLKELSSQKHNSTMTIPKYHVGKNFIPHFNVLFRAIYA